MVQALDQVGGRGNKVTELYLIENGRAQIKDRQEHRQSHLARCTRIRAIESTRPVSRAGMQRPPDLDSFGFE